ncbi:alternative ribosome rescue aminoacyl-tRNA hydrolase ArfB [Flavobacterium sp.]|uniref:alternative ribosome rescue aminoacyl-tRNA hydrolase ArfB n=1 Tax=Flavobacterium sp. TaxID=239 RepID=UPI003D0D4767
MNKQILQSELQFKAVRSGGAGGQHVNKVSSKVVLRFSIQDSTGLNDIEKTILKDKLASRLSKEGLLTLHAEDDRSQFKNKAIVTQRFFELLEKALIQPKIRKKTKTPKSAIEKRLKEKKIYAEIKKIRRKLDF